MRIAFGMAVLVALVALVTGCDSPTAPDWYGDRLDVTQWVVGEAAASLDERGQFILPRPHADVPILSPAEARDLAAACFDTFAFPDVAIGRTVGARLEAEHGSFDASSVRVHPTVYFAHSPYASLPDTLPISVRKYLGPRFATYYQLGRMLIGVTSGSALNTNLWVDDGKLRIPPGDGGGWITTVIPKGRSFTYPVTPERAVELVATRTGARVARVPRLLLPHRHYAPESARWEVVLDQPVAIQGDSTGRLYQTDTLYVGAAGPRTSGLPSNFEQVWVALAEQPSQDTVPTENPVVISILGPVRFEVALIP
jgi:hypothetical protein